MKKFFCWIGWHSILIGFNYSNYDGYIQHAKCKWCGFEGMIDSQGNLF